MINKRSSGADLNNAIIIIQNKLVNQSKVKILTENSKTPLSRALALASFLGTEYPPNLGARTAPPAKDLMAFGSVLAHNQHNIGRS